MVVASSSSPRSTSIRNCSAGVSMVRALLATSQIRLVRVTERVPATAQQFRDLEPIQVVCLGQNDRGTRWCGRSGWSRRTHSLTITRPASVSVYVVRSGRFLPGPLRPHRAVRPSPAVRRCDTGDAVGDGDQAIVVPLAQRGRRISYGCMSPSRSSARTMTPSGVVPVDGIPHRQSLEIWFGSNDPCWISLMDYTKA